MNIDDIIQRLYGDEEPVTEEEFRQIVSLLLGEISERVALLEHLLLQDDGEEEENGEMN